MDPVSQAAAIGAVDKIGAQYGFNAVLVLILIAACAIIVRAFLRFLREERTDARAERQQDRSEHLAALRPLTKSIVDLGEKVSGLHEAMRDTDPRMKRRGG